MEVLRNCARPAVEAVEGIEDNASLKRSVLFCREAASRSSLGEAPSSGVDIGGDGLCCVVLV